MAGVAVSAEFCESATKELLFSHCIALLERAVMDESKTSVPFKNSAFETFETKKEKISLRCPFQFPSLKSDLSGTSALPVQRGHGSLKHKHILSIYAFRSTIVRTPNGVRSTAQAFQ